MNAESTLRGCWPAWSLALPPLATMLSILCIFTLSACAPEHRGDATNSVAAAENGDVTRGRQLIAQYQCSRCHEARFAGNENGGDKACLGCHTAIVQGRGDRVAVGSRGHAREQAQQWDERLINMRYAPSLHGQATLMRRQWLVAFLRKPHDIRPRLGASMPRLALSQQDARDIVAALLDGEHTEPFFADTAIADYEREVLPLPVGDVTTGRALFLAKECNSCHNYSGVVASTTPLTLARTHSRAVTLAPDLIHARKRLKKMKVVPWLLAPRYHKADAAMPDMKLTYAEARHLAAFVMAAPIETAPTKVPAAAPKRLPLLGRDVFYEEVHREVFGKVCIHCHSEPDLELGDGGPGFSGGFGYRARGVSFASYEAIFGGRRGDDDRYYSLFTPRGDGTPFIVAAMLARQREERGEFGPLKGMPLGFPALSSTQIQLVESWIAQGRRR